MRKLTSLVLLLSLLAISNLSALAQSRPRRIEPYTAPQTAPPRPAAKPSPAQTPTAGDRDKQTRQETAEEVDEEGVVRVQTALVTIPVSVLDRDGRYVGDIRREEFRIYEDGVEQEVAYFGQVDMPFTVALVLDTSASTKFRLEDIQDAAIAFVEQLRPADSVLVVSFDSDVHVMSEATSDRRELRNAIRRTRTGGGTKLYDAVDFVINQRFNRVKGRKAIVLFTDGVDTASNRASFESTVAQAEELDALVYPVAYDTYDANTNGGGWPGSRPSIRIGPINIPLPKSGGTSGVPGTTRADYERGTRYLRTLAEMTGGRFQEAHDLRYLARSFEDIAEELRRQYSLGYYPKRQSQAAERRRVKVRVYRPNLAVRARDSYIYKPSGTNSPDDKRAQDDPNRRRTAPPELRKRQLTK